ncbi:Synaptobrevin [Zootermopsis nevadensis]|uniref:Synaptobrevin n=1 Tax=Zootermopsis nevadensis TaxID=136037 RepID=A0A067RSV2_ZOONE|nr:Synaptobrevin [Zootermopsis nevadensis]
MDSAGRYSGNGDDGVAGAQSNPQNHAAQKRLQQTQAKVEEVVGIMRVNVEKVLERDQKLSELDNRAECDSFRRHLTRALRVSDALQQGASQFEQQAGKLKRKYWWKNLKMMIIMGVIALLLITVLIVWATSGSSSDEPAAPPVTPATVTPSGHK